MTHEEFDPIIDGLQDTTKLASWLIEHEARLDVGQARGYAATRLVVPDPTGSNQWCIPLLGAIDMVDIDDGWFATEDPANLRVITTDDGGAVIEVAYHAIDDEVRRSNVDQSAMPTFEPIPVIPNN